MTTELNMYIAFHSGVAKKNKNKNKNKKHYTHTHTQTNKKQNKSKQNKTKQKTKTKKKKDLKIVRKYFFSNVFLSFRNQTSDPK